MTARREHAEPPSSRRRAQRLAELADAARACRDARSSAPCAPGARRRRDRGRARASRRRRVSSTIVALAQNLVGTLQERKGLGRSGIAAELTRRLLSPAAIEYALELIDTGDELARARDIAVAAGAPAHELRPRDGRPAALRRTSRDAATAAARCAQRSIMHYLVDTNRQRGAVPLTRGPRRL